MSDDTWSSDYSIMDTSDSSDDTLMGDNEHVPAEPLENHPQPAYIKKNPTPAPLMKKYTATPAYPQRARLIFLGGCPRPEWEKVVRDSDRLFDVVIYNPLEFLVFLSDYPGRDLGARMGRVVFWVQGGLREQHVPARFSKGEARVVPYWPGDFWFSTLEFAWPVPSLACLKRGWDGFVGGVWEGRGGLCWLKKEKPVDFGVELLARQWMLVIDEFLDGDGAKGDLEVYFELGDDGEIGDHPLMRHRPFLEKLERLDVDVGARPFRSCCDCSKGCMGFLVLRRPEWRGKTAGKSA
ncbi:hypothetical protein E2P81_ATG09178 [Venturia nashicola]|nr:hypothetical protein E2P81_ATG09178 [Venturia nashicola]